MSYSSGMQPRCTHQSSYTFPALDHTHRPRHTPPTDALSLGRTPCLPMRDPRDRILVYIRALGLFMMLYYIINRLCLRCEQSGTSDHHPSKHSQVFPLPQNPWPLHELGQIATTSSAKRNASAIYIILFILSLNVGYRRLSMLTLRRRGYCETKLKSPKRSKYLPIKVTSY